VKQFIGSHSRKKSGSATRANGIVARATVHLKKIADKSQNVGKRISRNGVMQQNPAATQQEIRFCASQCSASLSASTTLMEVRRVDLGLKLNVLAVCAVFVFVGAILLGAF
jgi:hypothetical protein